MGRRIKRGDLIVLEAMGGGFTWRGVVVRLHRAFRCNADCASVSWTSFRCLSGGKGDDMADAGTIRRTDAGTLTRADLADVIHREIGLSRADSAGIVERILHHMCHALSEGQNVKISGFGSFILRDKGERVGRNPKTGVEVPIAPRRVLTFRASQIMRERIAKGG
jgi:integration host factor subunit alpha